MHIEVKIGTGTRNTVLGARRQLMLGMIFIAMGILAIKAIDLAVFSKTSLQNFANGVHIIKVETPAYRGMITDRNGGPLAISTPVESIVIEPQHIRSSDKEKIMQLGTLLDVPSSKLQKLVDNKFNRRSILLKRRVNPEVVMKVKALDISGIYFYDEFKRYYPAGEFTGHLLGFTNIDDVGQEGIERFYEQALRGRAGEKTSIKDGKGRIIKDIESITDPAPGQDLRLSIDERIQYLAYRELRNAFLQHRAKAASLVVLNAKNGEVLALVNQPGFNPNNRDELKARAYRNRAIVDVFEPGSTMKPFIIASALDGGYITPATLIETQGWHRVGKNVVRDTHNYGTLSLTGVLKKSSNIAVSKIAQRLPGEYMYRELTALGFGSSANVGFPVEARGVMNDYSQWGEFQQATLSFGYGLSVSLLQLAKAYTALADDGVLHSVSLLPRAGDEEARRIFSTDTARKVRAMLEHVIDKDGTAYQARVHGYSVAGKTGTVKKAIRGGYAQDKYLALFVGMAPATDPRFIVAVMVDEPSAGPYYGGLVAAPVFANVMAGALRIYRITPDQEQTMPMIISRQSHEVG